MIPHELAPRVPVAPPGVLNSPRPGQSPIATENAEDRAGDRESSGGKSACYRIGLCLLLARLTDFELKHEIRGLESECWVQRGPHTLSCITGALGPGQVLTLQE